MIENVRKIICDGCGYITSFPSSGFDNYTLDLKGKAPDWLDIGFRSIDMSERKTVHFCPDCAKKFLAMFEKSDKKEESNNVDADGNEKRCDKCFYYERNTRYIGKCTHISKFVAAISHCSDYSGM